MRADAYIVWASGAHNMLFVPCHTYKGVLRAWVCRAWLCWLPLPRSGAPAWMLHLQSLRACRPSRPCAPLSASHRAQRCLQAATPGASKREGLEPVNGLICLGGALLLDCCAAVALRLLWALGAALGAAWEQFGSRREGRSTGTAFRDLTYGCGRSLAGILAASCRPSRACLLATAYGGLKTGPEMEGSERRAKDLRAVGVLRAEGAWPAPRALEGMSVRWRLCRFGLGGFERDGPVVAAGPAFCR